MALPTWLARFNRRWINPRAVNERQLAGPAVDVTHLSFQFPDAKG